MVLALVGEFSIIVINYIGRRKMAAFTNIVLSVLLWLQSPVFRAVECLELINVDFSIDR